MLTNLKALVLVLSVALTVFVLAKPFCLRFMAESDFDRRRFVWVALTIVAFASPSFWPFALAALPLLAWCASKDANPVALWVLTQFLIPPNVGAEIPVVGINKLFELDHFRILALAVLVPAAWRLFRSGGGPRSTALALTDTLVLSYFGLQLVLLMPYDSVTHTMRRGFLLFLDALVMYYVASRTCANRRAIVETMTCYCLLCAILAPLALFETLRGWLLYHSIGTLWGDPIAFGYLFRSGSLRAQVSTGHSLALGYVLAIGLGFWLYLKSRAHSMQLGRAVAIWLCAGLLAAYSRTPWIIAVVIVFGYLALGPNGLSRFVKGAVVFAVLSGLVLASPVGERVIDALPFVGSVDEANVIYRVRFAEMAWMLVQQQPLFGNPFVMLQLEVLRQGQGIIDLLNAYATVAMFYGLVGLALYVGPFLVCVWNAFRLTRRSAAYDRDLSLLGASLVACMLATLLALGAQGQDRGQLLYLLVGLLTGYAALGGLEERAPTQRVAAHRRQSPAGT